MCEYKKTKDVRHFSNFSRERKRKTMAEREVWYFLVDGTGQLVEGTSADAVDLTSSSSIRRFRKRVHIENPTKLSHCDPSGLVVYANKAGRMILCNRKMTLEIMEQRKASCM
jgi:hypothetical protein